MEVAAAVLAREAKFAETELTQFHHRWSVHCLVEHPGLSFLDLRQRKKHRGINTVLLISKVAGQT